MRRLRRSARCSKSDILPPSSSSTLATGSSGGLEMAIFFWLARNSFRDSFSPRGGSGEFRRGLQCGRGLRRPRGGAYRRFRVGFRIFFVGRGAVMLRHRGALLGLADAGFAVKLAHLLFEIGAEVAGGAAELGKRAAERAGEFRKFFGAEHNQSTEKNDYEMGHAEHFWCA